MRYSLLSSSSPAVVPKRKWNGDIWIACGSTTYVRDTPGNWVVLGSAACVWSKDDDFPLRILCLPGFGRTWRGTQTVRSESWARLSSPPAAANILSANPVNHIVAGWPGCVLLLTTGLYSVGSVALKRPFSAMEKRLALIRTNWKSTDREYLSRTYVNKCTNITFLNLCLVCQLSTSADIENSRSTEGGMPKIE